MDRAKSGGAARSTKAERLVAKHLRLPEWMVNEVDRVAGEHRRTFQAQLILLLEKVIQPPARGRRGRGRKPAQAHAAEGATA